MLGKRIDASKGRNNQRVEEFLTSTGPPQPELSDQQQDREDDSVTDESASHDEMGQTLASVIAPAESERGDSTEQHLYPTSHRHHFPHDTVSFQYNWPNASMDSLFQVKLEVDSERNLKHQHQHQGAGE